MSHTPSSPHGIRFVSLNLPSSLFLPLVCVCVCVCAHTSNLESTSLWHVSRDFLMDFELDNMVSWDAADQYWELLLSGTDR